MLLGIDPQTLFKISFINVTQIDTQTLLEINSTSGTKLKNLIAGTARLKL